MAEKAEKKDKDAARRRRRRLPEGSRQEGSRQGCR